MGSSFCAQICELIVIASEKGLLKKAVFSKSEDSGVVKAVASPRTIGAQRCVQIEIFHFDNKATHKNFFASDTSALVEFAARYGQINALTQVGECEYRLSSKGKELFLGGEKLLRKLEQSEARKDVDQETGNNRHKKYILDGSEPFLQLLGVSDKNGRVYDKRQSKFRQINRFLELVRDVEDKLCGKELRICDLCCGKSYLSFAVYHYFANVRGIKVSMTGVDLKSDVVKNCSDAAKALGFDGLEFVCADIREYISEVKPSLVISLHACDVATDIVLEKAAEWKADVILSTPCCHHELNGAINCEALSFITDYSMLRQKLCDAATDALRLKRLEAHGYSTVALELIDPEETPKNVMLRAVRKKNFDVDSPEAKRAMREYLDAKSFLCGNADTEKYHF